MVSKSPTGIRVRHSRSCPSRKGGNCTKGTRDGCALSYEAAVYSRRDAKQIRKAFPTLAAAKAWRADSTVALHKGTLRSSTATTLREAAEAWEKGAEDGSIRNRNGETYQPSVIRSYKASLRNRLLPDLGGAKLSEIRRTDIQDMVDRMLSEGLDASTIRNHVMPLRVIFRRAVARGELVVNPTLSLEMPRVEGKRDRIATAEEATALLAALPDVHRALWATAFYAGLRSGEIRGLRWEDVDLDAGVIRVERSWDEKVGPVRTKSKAGRRAVPIVAALRTHLIEQRLRTGRSTGLVFGRTATDSFTPSNVRKRSLTAWKKVNPIGLHECRHTFASILIAAGVNVKAISNYMGHSSITITLDRYGHLMPGHEAEAVEKIDTYLAQAAL